VLLEAGGSIVSHASIVERLLESKDHALRTGYVEAVATRPEHQGHGSATEVMHVVAGFIDERYELGALDTGLTAFYERLGWEPWRGPTAVRTERGTIGTPEEDGLVWGDARRGVRPTSTSVRRSPATGAPGTSGSRVPRTTVPPHAGATLGADDAGHRRRRILAFRRR